MRLLSFFAYFVITCLLYSCKGTEDATKFFDIHVEGNKKKFTNGEQVRVSIDNKKEKTITKISYFLDANELKAQDGKLTLEAPTLGRKKLSAKIDYDDSSVEVLKKIQLLAKEPPKVYTYEIINEYPHDQNAFTQGLEFKGDTLYESTGQLGKSTLRKVDYKTGKVWQEIKLKANEFGEGLTLIDDKIVQLTWKKRMGYMYDLTSFKQLGTFNYGKSKEGWGICNDGKMVYKSDGTEKIWLLDPENLAEQGYIETVTNKSIFNKTNELEYVDGLIYANVWQKDSMMIINAQTGAIVGVINFGGLKNKVAQHDKLDVLNGVAYHKERETFFVTGKNWNKLFEVKIREK